MSKNSEKGKGSEDAAPMVEKIVIDRDLCIGAAACTVLAPDVYEMDDENKAILSADWKGKKLSDDDHLEAARSCPVDAIFVYDKEDKQLHP